MLDSAHSILPSQQHVLSHTLRAALQNKVGNVFDQLCIGFFQMISCNMLICCWLSEVLPLMMHKGSATGYRQHHVQKPLSLT